MSGILGVMRKDGRPVTAQTLDPVYRAMRSWGPDGYRTWHKGSVGLGHLELRVAPASRSDRQPLILSAESGLVITADARIDNRTELMDALVIPRELRARLSDSALILRAYERWGTTCVERLVGAFAFAIWDARARTLFCGRDHIGLRPLLYVDTPRFFAFASDIRGVLAYPPVPRNLHEPLLAACLQQLTYTAEKRLTFYEGVVKLPPAHRLTVTAGASRLVRYWSPEDAPKVRLPSLAAYAERLRELLDEAVRCRVRTTYPVGSHLSGGLDSSTVTALAARHLWDVGRPPQAFSWSPPPEPGTPLEDERGHVEAVRRREAIACHYTTLSAADVFRVYGRDFTVEPTDMLIHETRVQERAARAGIRVMLSGWGGDEGVTTQARCYLAELLITGRWRRLYRELEALATGGGERPLRDCVKRAGSTLFHDAIVPLLPDGLYRHVEPLALNLPLPWACVNPDFARRYRREVRALRGPGYRECAHVRAWQIRWLTLGHLTRRIESWATSGARRGLTYAYPMLDKRLLTFCLGVPVTHLFRDGRRRFLFREAVRGLLPEALRLMPRKREPANKAVLNRLLPDALDEIFKRTRPRTVDAPVAAYVDVDALEEVLRQKDKWMLCAGVIIHTLGCFRVSALMDGEVRPMGP